VKPDRRASPEVKVRHVPVKSLGSPGLARPNPSNNTTHCNFDTGAPVLGVSDGAGFLVENKNEDTLDGVIESLAAGDYEVGSCAEIYSDPLSFAIIAAHISRPDNVLRNDTR
jgi:hypothetical protein